LWDTTASAGEKLENATRQERRGKGASMEASEKQKQVSTGSHTPLAISQKARDSHFPTAPTTGFCSEQNQSKSQTQTQGGGLTAVSLCFTKRTDH
jgi:hypothetical protein